MRPAPVSVTFKHDCMAFPCCAPLPHNEWLPPPEPQGRCEGESSIVDLLWNPRLHYSRPPLSLNPSHAPAYIAFLQQALAREGGRASGKEGGHPYGSPVNRLLLLPAPCETPAVTTVCAIGHTRRNQHTHRAHFLAVNICFFISLHHPSKSPSTHGALKCRKTDIALT